MMRKILLMGSFALVASLATGASGCFDEKSHCERYCEAAADCNNCGGAIDLGPCVQECVDLSLSEQQQLANCARSCPNLMICSQTTGINPPNPCFQQP